MKKIVKACPGLVEFDVSDCTNLTSGTLETIASGLPNLQRLSLSRCYNMAGSNFVQLEKISSLRHLELFGVLHDSVLASLTLDLENITINRSPFSTIARPTTGFHRTSLWGLRVRDCWGQSMKIEFLEVIPISFIRSKLWLVWFIFWVHYGLKIKDLSNYANRGH